MDRIFNADNGFFRFINKLVDCIAISFCWCLCNLPMAALLFVVSQVVQLNGRITYVELLILLVAVLFSFLSGPATSALYYVIVKNIRHNHGYSWPSYWHGFRDNFKQGFVAGLISLGLLYIFSMDIYFVSLFMYDGKIGPLCYFFIVMIIVVLMWMTTMFSYISRFENDTKTALKNSFLITIGNLPKSFLQVIILAVFVYIMYLLWPFPLYFIFPAVYMLIKSFLLEKTFRKYMSEEDIKAEDERNREYKN